MWMQTTGPIEALNEMSRGFLAPQTVATRLVTDLAPLADAAYREDLHSTAVGLLAVGWSKAEVAALILEELHSFDVPFTQLCAM